MDSIHQNKKRFFAALEEFKKSYGHGIQNYLAVSTGASKGYISQLFQVFKGKKLEDVTVSFELQVKIAQACKFDYVDFLNRGKEILEGNGSAIPPLSVPNLDKNLTSELSSEILQTVLNEINVKITDKQKKAIVKILISNLKEAEAKNKAEITKYLLAFGK